MSDEQTTNGQNSGVQNASGQSTSGQGTSGQSPQGRKLPLLVELCLVFAKIGCLCFGGGYAMLPIVERELVKNRGWTTMDDAAEYYSIAQVTPGVIAVNMCTFIGYKKAGIAGGILATAAFLAPSVILVIILSLTLSNFARHPAVERCMMGIRVAVTALVLSTVITLVKNAIKDYRQAALCVLCLAFSFVWKANPAVLIIASGAAGFLFYSRGGGARTKPGDEK